MPSSLSAKLCKVLRFSFTDSLFGGHVGSFFFSAGVGKTEESGAREGWVSFCLRRGIGVRVKGVTGRDAIVAP